MQAAGWAIGTAMNTTACGITKRASGLRAMGDAFPSIQIWIGGEPESGDKYALIITESDMVGAIMIYRFYSKKALTGLGMYSIIGGVSTKRSRRRRCQIQYSSSESLCG